MVSARAMWTACIVALSLSASSAVPPARVMVGPPEREASEISVWEIVSEWMTQLVVVLPGQLSVDMMIAVFKTRWLSPGNQSVIVHAIGDAYRRDYALVPPAPVQSAAERSVSAEFGLADGRVSMEVPNAYITRRNARIVAFLMAAAEDPDDVIASAAVSAYGEFADSSDAMRLVRRAFYRGVLPTGSFIRHAFHHLPNLDMAEQDAMIDELIHAEQADPERTGDLSLRGFIYAFFGPDREGMESLSPTGRAAFMRYLDADGPDPYALQMERLRTGATGP